MDDLIVAGTAGICVLIIAAAFFLYGLFIVIAAAGHAIVSGDFEFLFCIILIAVLAISGYTATGLWLHRTGWI